MPKEIDVQQLPEHLKNGQTVHLLDVRQPWENEIAALPESLLIPLDQLMVRSSEMAHLKEDLLVVYCHHGIRSLSAAALLEHLGFQNVCSLGGGIDAWSLMIDPTVPRY